MTCEHEDFIANVSVGRIQESEQNPVVIGYAADITVACSQCGERFRWNCPTVGVLPSEPTVSVDGYELRAPLRPGSKDEDFGRGIPGVRMRVTHNG